MKEPVFFDGTAYLGLAGNAEFKKLVFEGIEQYGINYGASRNNSHTPDIYRLAEAEAAERCLAEDAIIVSSGYLAAQLVVQHYLSSHRFIYAPDTHPALWIGRPGPPQIKFTEWVEQIIPEVNKSEGPVLLITNSLNNLIPEIYEFDWLTKILPAKQVTLLVDDSHGIGITGSSGQGVYSRMPRMPNVEILVISSMAKALSIDAGLVLGTNKIINELRDSAVYIGSSPPSPGILYAYVKASKLYSTQLTKLQENIAFFQGILKNPAGLTYVPGFPVFLLQTPVSYQYLESKGMIISSLTYPDPRGEILNRIVINSKHTQEELKNLAAALKEIKEQGAKNKGRFE